MKRVIALLLVCCTMALSLIACNSDTKQTTGAGSTEAPKATDQYGQEALIGKTDWSTIDLDGEELTVLVRNDEKVSREWEKKDVGDDELDIAIAERNEVIEGNLNVDVSITLAANDNYNTWQSDFIPILTRDVDNKLHEIDIVANWGYDGMNAALRDYYLNLLDEDTFPYFDFSLACWNQGIYQNGTVNGKLYLCAGDMNLSMFDSSMIIWHNMDLYDRLRQSDDPADIQDLVLSGQWTYAEMYRWASTYINGGSDSECNDIYGVSIQGATFPEQPGMAIPYAWDLSFVTTNADGTHTFNLTNNTKAEKALEDFRKLYGAGGNAWDVFTEKKSDKCTCGTGGHFVSGHILFKGDVIFWDKASNLAIREMKDRYAILCWPKYDTKQEQYATTSQDYFTCMMVLDHSKSSVPTKGEAVSAYLQYGTEYSYTYVRGYYFEKIIKPKFFGTDDSDGHVTKSITIFTTIIDNLGYEFETIYSPMLERVINRVWKDSLHGGGTIQQKYTAKKNAYDNALKELDKWLFA